MKTCYSYEKSLASSNTKRHSGTRNHVHARDIKLWLKKNKCKFIVLKQIIYVVSSPESSVFVRYDKSFRFPEARTSLELQGNASWRSKTSNSPPGGQKMTNNIIPAISFIYSFIHGSY